MKLTRALDVVRWLMLPLAVALMVGWFMLFYLNDYAEEDLASGISGALAFFTFLVVGALILMHQRGNVVGWICAIIGTGFLYMSFAQQYSIYAYTTNPGGLPLREVIAWTTMFAWITPIALPLTLLLLLFPNGRPKSPRWRAVAIVNVCQIVTIVALSAIVKDEVDPGDGLINPFAWTRLDVVLNPLRTALEPSLLVMFLLCAASAILRFRASTAVERLQMKWFAYSVGASLFLLLGNDFLEDGDSIVLFAAALGLLAASIGVSVLRYRLYDIDRLINRTLVYGLLSAVLAAVYFGLVVALQEALHPLSGGSDLAVVLTTLVVAALFLPGRQRIQNVVDRRFNRRTYDATRTIDAFSARLRQQIELDALHVELPQLVDATMAPSRTMLWLRTGARWTP